MHPHVMLTTLRNATRALHPQTYLKYSNQNLSILSLLLTHGFLSSVSLGSSQNPHPLAFQSAPAPGRLLVAKLKYRGDRSVISTLDLVSKPGKNILMTAEELARLLQGRRVQGVRGIGLGEVVLVKTGKDEWLEGRDAVRQGLGGEVMVRVGSE